MYQFVRENLVAADSQRRRNNVNIGGPSFMYGDQSRKQLFEHMSRCYTLTILPEIYLTYLILSGATRQTQTKNGNTAMFLFVAQVVLKIS